MGKPILSFSPDGDILAVAGGVQNTNRLIVYGLWDKTKKEVAEFSGRLLRMQYPDDIICIEYNPPSGSPYTHLSNTHISVFTPDRGKAFYFDFFGEKSTGL